MQSLVASACIFFNVFIRLFFNTLDAMRCDEHQEGRCRCRDVDADADVHIDADADEDTGSSGR